MKQDLSFFKTAQLLLVFRASSLKNGTTKHLVFQFSGKDWEPKDDLTALKGLELFSGIVCRDQRVTREYRDLKLVGFQWVNHDCHSLIITLKASQKISQVPRSWNRQSIFTISLSEENEKKRLKARLEKSLSEEILLREKGHERVRLVDFQFLP